jgi:hypothetical protein
MGLLVDGQRTLLDEHPYKDDYEQVLREAVSQTTSVWNKFGGIIPFAIVLTTNAEIAIVGGPEQIPTDCIGIREWIQKRLQQIKASLQAVAFVQLSKANGKTFIQAELDHCNGPSLRAFYTLPVSPHWWVETYKKIIW